MTNFRRNFRIAKLSVVLLKITSENLPAPGEGPLSSAVVAKAEDGDDGGGRADLLRKDDEGGMYSEEEE